MNHNFIIDLIKAAYVKGILFSVVDGQLEIAVYEGVEIDPLLLTEIKENKQTLLDFFKEHEFFYAALPAYNDPYFSDSLYYNRAPLSFSQERFWFIDRLAGSIQYHMPVAIRLKGPLDAAALQEAWRQLMERHRILRTVIVAHGEDRWQTVLPAESWTMETADVSAFYTPDTFRADHIMQPLLNIPFALDEDYPFRVRLFTLSEQEHLMGCVFHHIIADGWSVGIIFRELMALYQSVRGQATLRLSPVLQYADFSIWQRCQVRNVLMEEGLAYWKKKLDKVRTITFPGDFTRGNAANVNGASISFSIDQETKTALAGLGKIYNVSLFTILVAAFKVLLHRYTGMTDICIGTVVAGRDRRAFEGIVGCFINSIALRTDIDGNPAFDKYLLQTGEAVLGGLQHQYVPFEQVINAVWKERELSNNPLFQVLFIYQGMLEKSAIEQGDLDVAFEPVQSGTSRMDITCSVSDEENGLSGTIEYSTGLYREETVRGIVRHYIQLLRSISAAPGENIGQLNILTSDERYQLLAAFAGDMPEYPRDKTIIGLFEEQAALHAGKVAVVCEGRRLTYEELDQQANRLGHFLQHKGVAEEVLVPILLDRSVEMVVAILAVLKAGGAYVPVDPEYPADRIFAMLAQCGKVVVSGTAVLNGITLPEDTIVVDVINGLPDGLPAHAPMRTNNPAATAYAMFTSGTTGLPKGVPISHTNVIRLFKTDRVIYDFNDQDVWALFHSFCFDISVWEMYGALFYGGRLVVVPRKVTKDAALFGRLLEEEEVTILSQTPSVFYSFQDYALAAGLRLNVRCVIFGGEALLPFKLQPWRQSYPECRLVNMYGITETTVYVTYHELTESDFDGLASVIGKPIPTATIYILDQYYNPVPRGVPGEIYIGGAAVGKGYLNRPELMSVKFLSGILPETGETCLYKSGDLAKWRADGAIEYLGRIDTQVKIRGYRIELEEIEYHVMQFGGIRHVVPVVKEKGDDKFLVVFYAADEEIDPHSMRDFLRTRLPEYMQPRYFQYLQQIPVTSNGKADYKLLQQQEVTIEEAYVAPATRLEKLLADIWCGVLGLERVGINDNFFAIGGDSIKSIQINARLRNHGYEMSVIDLFTYQHIRELAPRIKPVENVSDQSPVTGPVPLSPVQRWFFEASQGDLHYFNQSVLLNFPQTISAETVLTVFNRLLEHHDALRTTFKTVQGTVLQECQPAGVVLSITEFDWRAEADHLEKLEEESGKIQGGINLEKGPLVRLGLFHVKDGSRLLIVVHHLVIDGVSWRILFEDMETLLRQLAAGAKLKLPLKTDAFSIWSRRLEEYAQSDVCQKTAAYWKEITGITANAVTPDHADAVPLYHNRQSLSFTLSREDTSRLLTKCFRAFNTQINDLLLVAFSLSIRKIYGRDIIKIDLEGHGRDTALLPGINVSRTVGWFTAIYPVLLQCTGGHTGDIIQVIKENLRGVPDKGTDYLLSRYYGETSANQAAAATIRFNYLGQFDADVENSMFVFAGEPKGSDVGGNRRLEYDWDVSGIIIDRELTLGITFGPERYHAATVQRFLDEFKVSLLEVIDYCCSCNVSLLSPSDLTCKELSIAQLNALQRRHAIKDIYPLSPMQYGMYYHYLYNGDSSEYFQQMSFDIAGTMDVAVFDRAVNTLVERHDTLRTLFLHKGFGKPLQIVLSEQPAALSYKDISAECLNGMQEETMRRYREEDFQDKFDLSNAPPLRFRLFRIAADRHMLVWSYHHIIMDGWCLSLLFAELKKLYSAYLRKEEVALPMPHPYSGYITWLEKQNRELSAQYWSTYLDGYDKLAELPKYGAAAAGFTPRSVEMIMDHKETQLLNDLSRNMGVTVNTILLAAWAVLLSRYNNTRDVLLGSVVSGRPWELPGVETMVGLFINTIPVRFSFEEEDTVASLLRTAQRKALESEPHHYYPLAEIQSANKFSRLFDHIIVFENYPLEEEISRQKGAHAEDTGFTVTDFTNFERTNFDLSIMIVPREQTLVKFDFNSHVYMPGMIRDIAAQLKFILLQMVENKEATITRLQLATPPEEAPVPTFDKSLADLFRETAQRYPDDPAVLSEDGNLTFRQLEERSNQLGHYLIKAGITPEAMVPICINRGPDAIVGILGILKAGGAYVPVDPSYPAERIRHIRSETGNTIAVTYSGYQSKLEGPFVSLDDHRELIMKEPVTPPEVQVAPGQLAYVVYTSGSTGNPKGVMVEHSAVINLINTQTQNYGISRDERIMQFSNYCFDTSTEQIFLGLLNGCPIFAVSEKQIADPKLFVKALRDYKITHIDATPSYMEMLDLSDLPHLRRMVCGGELCRRDLPEKWGTHFDFYNAYGPTEATITAFMYKLKKGEPLRGNTVPIGNPLANVHAYIFSSSGQLNPVGASGEIYIGGAGLARGYLNNAQLTDQLFVPNPFGPGKLYRTGDLGRWLPDGTIEYLGRIDEQIKIRGLRIETAEIEFHMLRYPGLENVTVVGTGSGSKAMLAAYYVAEKHIDAREMKRFLATSLPDYMVPVHYIRLDRIPLNINGKVDKEKLPAPAVSPSNTGDTGLTGRTQQVLAGIWSDILPVSNADIGADSNFFDVGGNSLTMISLMDKVNTHFETDISIADLFEYASIGALAGYLDGIQTSMEPGGDTVLSADAINETLGLFNMNDNIN